MIVKDTFALDENRREKLTSLAEDYPYVCLDVTLDRLMGRSWHWHNAFEVDLILEGKMELKTTRQSCILTPGDVVFINSCVMHDARAVSQREGCRLYAQLFEPLFLSGMYEGRIEKKYIRPVRTCSALDLWVFRHDQEERTVPGLVSGLIRLNVTDLFGSEFRIRNGLSELWCALLQDTEAFRSGNGGGDRRTPDNDRLRTMIQFIRERYMDEIRVADIAQSANISLRECHRCFQRNVGSSPNAFLTDYRLRTAAGMLKETGESVMRISVDCGFSSQSYFSRLFRSRFGCSPLEYRKSAVL